MTMHIWPSFCSTCNGEVCALQCTTATCVDLCCRKQCCSSILHDNKLAIILSFQRTTEEAYTFYTIIGRPFIKRFALCYWTTVLSVCDVGALWPNGWTDQDEIWHTGRPRPWPHCIRWGSSSPHEKGHSNPHIRNLRAQALPNDCMDQDETWHGRRPRPSPNCVKWGPSSPSPKGHSPLPPKKFGHVCCSQTAGWIKMQLGTEVGLSPGHTVLDGDPAPSSKEAQPPPFFGAYLLWQNVWMDQDATW